MTSRGQHNNDCGESLNERSESLMRKEPIFAFAVANQAVNLFKSSSDVRHAAKPGSFI